MYNVSLGNHVNKWFSNRKHAIQFLAYINEELNRNLHELNFIYGFVLCEYRKIWCYLQDTHSDDKIENHIRSINHGFKMACKGSALTDGNHFTFKHLNLVIEGIQELCDMVLETLVERKYYADVHRIEVFQRMLHQTKEYIDTLGENVVLDKPEELIEEND